MLFDCLRDRALIGVMVYTFARINAVVSMQVEDYFANESAGGRGCRRKVASVTRCRFRAVPRRISGSGRHRR
jgi:hypothetical protein